MGAPSAPPPKTPTLMSTDVNQSIHAIPYKDFDGFLDFMAKKVILAILAIFAILGVEDAPPPTGRVSTGLNWESI